MSRKSSAGRFSIVQPVLSNKNRFTARLLARRFFVAAKAVAAFEGGDFRPAVLNKNAFICSYLAT